MLTKGGVQSSRFRCTVQKPFSPLDASAYRMSQSLGSCFDNRSERLGGMLVVARMTTWTQTWLKEERTRWTRECDSACPNSHQHETMGSVHWVGTMDANLNKANFVCVLCRVRNCWRIVIVIPQHIALLYGTHLSCVIRTFLIRNISVPTIFLYFRPF